MPLTMVSMVYAHRYDQDMTDAYTEFYVEKGSETSSHTHTSHTHTLHCAPSLERKNSFKASSKGQVLQERRKREKESLWVKGQVLRGGEGEVERERGREGEREAHSG